MTDRCAPPDGTDTEWHWIEMSRGPHLARWNVIRQSWWAIERGSLTPFQMQQAGYRYLRPARPDDAEAREPLEQENKRLREALALIANSEVAVTMPWTHEIAADAFSAALHRNRSAAKEALNAR